MKQWISNWYLGEKIPQQGNTDLEKGFQRMMLAIRKWGKGWCVMSCVQVVWWCVIVSVCACHLSVCVSVCMWVPDLGLNPDSDTEKCSGGNLGTLKEQKCRNEDSVTEVRSQWLWKGGADGWLCKLCKQYEGFWRQALEEKEKLSLLAVLSPG